MPVEWPGWVTNGTSLKAARCAGSSFSQVSAGVVDELPNATFGGEILPLACKGLARTIVDTTLHAKNCYRRMSCEKQIVSWGDLEAT
jgi:hypothetical protein